jgi:hypothetical protein
MLDNIQIAILNKVNELANRFEVKPYDFVAVIDNASDRSAMILRYEVPPSRNESKVEAFNKMLDLLGAPPSGHEFKGTPQEIIEALDNAIRLAPRSRSGHT